MFQDIYASTPVVFGTQPDVLHRIGMNSSTNSAILTFYIPIAATSRLEVVVTPALGVDFFMSNINRTNYKSRVKHVWLFPRPAYMGPSPPSFFEQILHDKQWVLGITVYITLRMHIAHNLTCLLELQIESFPSVQSSNKYTYKKHAFCMMFTVCLYLYIHCLLRVVCGYLPITRTLKQLVR